MGVKEEVIRDIASLQCKRHFEALVFLNHLKATAPDLLLNELKQNIQEIGRNDVVEFIDSHLGEFLFKRLDEIPCEKLEEVMKQLEVKLTPITKYWKNLAVLLGLRDKEINRIASYAFSLAEEGPLDYLIDYLEKTAPWLTVADIGRVLESLDLNGASLMLYREVLKSEAFYCNLQY